MADAGHSLLMAYRTATAPVAIRTKSTAKLGMPDAAADSAAAASRTRGGMPDAADTDLAP